MLAETVTDLFSLRFPVLCTPKIDGIRCMIQEGQPVTRALKPIPNRHIRDCLSRMPEGVDGEIIAGLTFQETESAVMTHSGTPDFHYFVFDIIKDDPYHVRASASAALIANSDAAFALPVNATPCHDVDDIIRYERYCLDRGYEGIIIRDPMGPYKHGRSTLSQQWMLKLKRFLDAEAVILGTTSLFRNTNDAKTNELGYKDRPTYADGMVPDEQLGSLQVRDCKTGIEFSVGTGFDQAQRKELWTRRDELVGQYITYKSLPFGVKDKPRHPVFKGFCRDRQPETISGVV